MFTVSMSDSFRDGIGLVESSSRKVKGKSFFDARTIDRHRWTGDILRKYE